MLDEDLANPNKEGIEGDFSVADETAALIDQMSFEGCQDPALGGRAFEQHPRGLMSEDFVSKNSNLAIQGHLFRARGI